MLQLPALESDELAYLQTLQASGGLQALASRLRQRFVAALGVAVSVSASPGTISGDSLSGDEPEIRIDRALADAWLAVRFGGRPGTPSGQSADAALIGPFKWLIRRALAETVVNLGPDVAWSPALSLQVAIGGQQGTVEIFWNSAHALSWARRAIGGKS
jgi:hypothetical protein